MNLTLPVSFYTSIINYRVIFTLLVLVMFTSKIDQLFAQTNQKVPVEEEPYFADQDSIEAQRLFDGFILHVGEDADSAKIYAEASYKMAVDLKDSLLIVRSGYALGYLYKEEGEFDLARQYYRTAAEIAVNHKHDSLYYGRIKAIYNGLGLTNQLQGFFDRSFEAHFKSIEYRKEEIDSTGDIKSANLGIAYTNIGVAFYRYGDLYQAIDFQHKALSEFSKIEHPEIADNYTNLGLAYSQILSSSASLDERQSYAEDSSLYYFYLAQNRCDEYEYCEDRTLFEVYNGLAQLFDKIDISDSASFYLNKAIQVDQDNPVNQTIALHNQARFESRQQNYNNAIESLNKAQVLIDSLNLLEFSVENLRLYSEIFVTLDNYKLAYNYLNRSDSIRDYIFNENIVNKTKSLVLEYEEQDNLATIAEKQTTIEQNETEIQEQETRLLFLSITVVLIIIFSVILFRANISRKRANQQLKEANLTIEEKNQMLETLNNELEERVRDRTSELNDANEALQQSNQELDNFIYKTSHDIRGPLATLQGICNVALMDVQDTKSIDYLQKLGKTAARLNEILSKLLVINQINSAMIAQEEIDFELIVDHVVQDNRKTNAAEIAVIKEIDPSIDFKSDHDLVKIIFSNLVNNSFKYYNQSDRIESFVKIVVDADSKNLKISIVDNGIGIDEQQGEKIFEIFSKASHMSDTAGLGLYLVKLAVEKLQGQVKLLKTREKFTEFRVKIPLFDG